MPSPPAASPPADILPVQRRSTLTHRLARIVVLPVLHVVFVFQVKGQPAYPEPRGPKLFRHRLTDLL